MVSDPVDVLRLVTRLNVGGPARHALILTRELADTYPTLLAAGRPGPHEGELSDSAVPVVPVPLVRQPSPVSDVRAVRRVRQLLASTGARLLHTHMAKAGAVGRVAAATLRPRPRTVHTFHGHVMEGYFSRPVERAIVRTERWLARRTDVLVAISPQIRDELIELGIGRPEQYRVVPLGLELDPFLAVEAPSGMLRDRLGLGPDVPLIGIVGRLVPIKDHATLFSALGRLPGVHVAVMGDGELRGGLESLTRDLGIEERVHFTGWVHDVAAAVSDLDLVVLTSRNEGTPVALIEAHAAGIAAVATDVGGVEAVVEDGRTGRLVAPGDGAALAGAIAGLLADPSTRRAMGVAGRRRVAERFHQRRLVDDVGNLYAELLGPRPATGGRTR